MPGSTHKIELAARDPDLVALYELEMTGDTRSISPNRRAHMELMPDGEVLWLRRDLMRDYDLSEVEFPSVVGRCVANIAGVQLGKDIFDDQA